MKHRSDAALTSGATQFQYFLNPTLVDVGATTQLLLTVTNPSSDEIAFERGRLPARLEKGSVFEASPSTSILVQLPAGDDASSLVSTANLAQIGCTSLDKKWACTTLSTSGGTYFKIYPLQGGTLGPGGTVQIQFSNVQVLDSQGGPVIQIFETVGNQRGQTLINMLKVQPSLRIEAMAVPAVVGLGQTTTIDWTASGGAQVTIAGSGQPIVIKLEGEGPMYSGQTPVLPNQTEPQTTFTVTVQTPDHQQQSTPVTVQLSPPLIQQFTASPQGPIDTDQPVTFQWNVSYASQVFLKPSPNGGSGQVVPQGSRILSPGSMRVGNQDSLAFQLSANGFQPPPPQSLTLAFNPVRIRYFRYTDLQSQQIEYAVENGNGALNYGADNLVTLTATGPRGPLTQYLGPGPYLQIQYFAASSNPAAPGTPVTLSWVVANAETLTLHPGDIPVTANAAGQGSYSVQPDDTTTYVLVAEGDSQTVASELTVEVDS